MPRSTPFPATLGCVACVGLAGLVLHLGDARQASAAFVATALVWAGVASGTAWGVRGRQALPWGVLAAAVILRAVILATEPTLSDDLYRYLWEGRVLAAGFDPFLLPPDAPALAHLRDPTWALVNHRGVSTIYPPLALGLFEAVARLAPSALSWKLLAALADLGCLAGIAHLARARGVGAWAPTLWALHPLPVLESAGSGHLESLALAPLLGALALAWRRPVLATAAATLGSLVKLLPMGLIAPIALKARGRTRAAVIGAALALWLAALAPWLDSGAVLGRGFGRYYQAWAFNGSLFPLLERAIGDAAGARLVGVGLGAALCLWALWRRPEPAAWWLWATGALVLLSPVVHPWYLLWPLAAALVVGAWPWAVLASTVLLSYLALGSYDQASSAWQEARWIPWVEYPPLLVATLVWLRRRPRPSPP